MLHGGISTLKVTSEHAHYRGRPHHHFEFVFERTPPVRKFVAVVCGNKRTNPPIHASIASCFVRFFAEFCARFAGNLVYFRRRRSLMTGDSRRVAEPSLHISITKGGNPR